MNRLMQTTNDLTLAILRIGLGVVIFPHGAQKLLGWFGGSGPGGTIGFFQQTWGIPAIVTVLVIGAESFGSLALIAGFMSRIAAAGIAIVMLGAVTLVHWPVGFFMNWGGQQSGEGFEFHVLAIAMAIALVIGGGGAFSVDRVLAASGREVEERLGETARR